MIIDLKFSRFESAPWGFRLVGGSDYDIPLTVIKVTEGSLAEEAGLRVGDVIVRINDETTSWMSHNDAHDAIMHAGNNFLFGVMRAQDDDQDQSCKEIQQNEQTLNENEVQHTPDVRNKSPVSNTTEQTSQENQIPPQSVHPDDQHNIADEEISELMSDQEEIIPEHDVTGVFPKPGICMSSEVLQTLNEESSIKTEKDLEKEKRKWTTFLQKPNRPIPKSKQELEEEAKRIPYVVKIVKQSKPRVAPDRPPSPPPPPVIEPEPEPEPEVQEEEPLGPEPSDSEVPNLEEASLKVEEQNEFLQEIHQMSETVTEQHIVQEVQTVVESSEKTERKIEVIEKTAEELALEKQLADVQKQLLALSTLPSTIQATLDAVTKQLSDLLPTFRLQPSPTPLEQKFNEEANRRDKETAEMMKICQDHITKLSEKKILEIPCIPPRPTVEQIEQKRREELEIQLQDELTYKKQKEQTLITELEQKQRSIREGTPRKSKRLFGPLTPQERPLILPGGRKWRKPKDAYNDEFIAEVLTSQAELITGTTLGRTSEISNLPPDERHYNFIALTAEPKQRVNFLKYQKPEKKIDLEKSEVYKVIHHLERGPIRGIEVRPPKVLAEEDIRRCATPSPTPISCT